MSNALPAFADVGGTVFMSKGGRHALLVWDCTPVVADMVADKAGARALSTLESQAMTLAGERAKSLEKSETIAVQVVYQLTGAVDPAYGAATFAGVETVFTLSVSTRLAKTAGASFARSLAKGSTPRSVTIAVTGKLPPM